MKQTETGIEAGLGFFMTKWTRRRKRFRLRKQPTSESEWGRRATEIAGCRRRLRVVTRGDIGDDPVRVGGSGVEDRNFVPNSHDRLYLRVRRGEE